jgi:hypothetical protein
MKAWYTALPTTKTVRKCLGPHHSADVAQIGFAPSIPSGAYLSGHLQQHTILLCRCAAFGGGEPPRSSVLRTGLQSRTRFFRLQRPAGKLATGDRSGLLLEAGWLHCDHSGTSSARPVTSLLHTPAEETTFPAGSRLGARVHEEFSKPMPAGQGERGCPSWTRGCPRRFGGVGALAGRRVVKREVL